MIKRKRSGLDDGPAPPQKRSQRPHRNRPSIDATLTEGTTKVFRALKVARGFERQKLGRRQKHAERSQDAAQLQRLEEEVQALKSLDLNQTAAFYLVRNIVRTKSIAAAPAFPADLKVRAQQPSPYQGPILSNVTARLFKSTLVRVAIETSLQQVRQILQVTADQSAVVERNVRSKNDSSSSAAQRYSSPTLKRNAELSSVDASEDIGSDEEALNDLQSRLAPASVSGSEDSEGISLQDGSKASGLSSDETSDAVSEDDEGQSLRRRRMPQSQARAGSSTFLPSLSMGGYISGSESGSEASDLDGDRALPRRNRRGQRARRAIWEKKYGSGANHVRKQKDSRDYGWDMRKGAQSEPRERPRSTRPPDSKEDSAPPASATKRSKELRQPAKSKPSQTALHPSWQAAKQRKDESHKVAFQGKKVVFD